MARPHTGKKLRLVHSRQNEVQNPARETGMTQSIWNLNWRNHFPYALGKSGVVAHVATLGDVGQFMQRNFTEVYQEDPSKVPFLVAEAAGENKKNFYQMNGDFFVFRDGEDVVGTFVGTALDWSSYYLRNCSILPRYQGQRLYQIFLVYLLECMKNNGVERAEGDIVPSNLGHIHVLNKLQFNITGFNISERWGPIVHFTKFLSHKHEEAFLRQYCWGVVPQRSGSGSRK